MAVDYLHLLADLIYEREAWAKKRDDADRELSRLSDLIRTTFRILPPEQREVCGETIAAHIEAMHSPGLTKPIRSVFAADRRWLSPTDVRDHLKRIGFDFETYKANPLVSIHTTLRRMVPMLGVVIL